MATLQGGQDEARNLYSASQPLRADFPAEGHVCISTARLLGFLPDTMGNREQAITHFEDALKFCCKVGYRSELAWRSSNYAGTLLDLDNKKDRARAISLLDESLAISSEIDMQPLMERVLSRREIFKA